MKTLILIDIQNDFLPSGALAVPEGDLIVPRINEILPQYDLVVATQDWHPHNHASFAANHPGREVYEVIQLEGLSQVAIDAAGSFGGIYQSAVYAYGSDLIKDPIDAERFADLKYLQALDKGGTFKGQTIAIAPIRLAAKGTLESDPLLSKDIRFLFEANSANLDLGNQDNIRNLEAIKKLVQVSPGSTLLLRGHVDNALVARFREQGGEAYVRTQALRAMELSKNRAAEIRKVLNEKYSIPAARIDVVGRGWEEPLSGDSEQNRRVEVQWFTLE